MGARVFGIECDGGINELQCSPGPFFIEYALKQRVGFEDEVLRVDITGAPQHQHGTAGAPQRDLQRLRDAFGDISLDPDRITGTPIVFLRPALNAGRAVDQLRGNPDC